jgi:hypothetical protein
MRVRAAALLLMADDLADVVWTGSAAPHLRESLEAAFTRADVRAAWSIISPARHAARLSARPLLRPQVGDACAVREPLSDSQPPGMRVPTIVTTD